MKLMEIVVDNENLNFIDERINEKLDEMFDKDPTNPPFDKEGEGLLEGRFIIKIFFEEI